MIKKDFLKAFDNGKVYKGGVGYAIIRCYEAGELNISSGKLIACDPFSSLESEPLDENLKPGKYPVIISVVHYDVAADVASAMIRFKDGIPNKWVNALGYDNHGRELAIPVDSAHACFIDAQSAQNLHDSLYAKGWDQKAYDKFQQRIEDSMKKNFFLFADITITKENKGENIIVFSSGYGDGGYPCYWGYNENGIICLLIDFLVFDPEKYTTWPDNKEIPQIPNYGESFFDWLVDIGQIFKEPIINKQSLEKNLVDYISNFVDFKIPDEISTYYKFCTPWENLEEPKNDWQKIFKHIKEKHNFEALPIFVDNLESYIVAKLINKENYEVWNIYKDGFYLRAFDIRTFFINLILTTYL
ncbi:MAG: DUF4241 domain-containing protein [Promethearchaeota archaeon]